MRPSEFRLSCARASTVAGLRVSGLPLGGFAKVRVWVEPGDPLRSNAVEAPVHLWNKGLNPLVECPGGGAVVVHVGDLLVGAVEVLLKEETLAT